MTDPPPRTNINIRFLNDSDIQNQFPECFLLEPKPMSGSQKKKN
jgi:hypothetical protein